MGDITAIVLAVVVGWFIGGLMMLDNWDSSAKRGMFEIGHVVYVAKPLRSTVPGTVCGLDVPGVDACTDGNRPSR